MRDSKEFNDTLDYVIATLHRQDAQIRTLLAMNAEVARRAGMSDDLVYEHYQMTWRNVLMGKIDEIAENSPGVAAKIKETFRKYDEQENIDS